MAWDVSDDPVGFDEAIAWFRKRVAVTKSAYERLSAKEKRKAFTVANVAQLDLVTHVWTALDAAVKNGTTLEEFKKSVGPDLRKAWTGKVDEPAWRLETIFRTNLQGAYGAGRFKQARDPAVLGDRPVWMFDAILDGRITPICKACDGTKLPAESPWWQSHTPPLHHNCRSGFVALTEKQAGRITLQAPTIGPAEGFGSSPSDDEWLPDPTKYPPPLAAVHLQKQAAAPPPPAPSRMQDGVHVKKVEVGRGVAKATAADMLASVDDPGLLDFLEKSPLERLAFRKLAKIGRKAVNGWYRPGAAELEVTADRPATSFGATFTPGTVHSMSTSASTKDQAAKATLKHELGHHVHLVQPQAKADAIVAAAYKRASTAGIYITKYASSSSREYFAESFTAYYLRRGDLQRHDPNAFAMVEAVLTERGILP